MNELGKLLEHSWRFAFPFLLAQGGLAIWLFFGLRKILAEARALDYWQPGSPPRGSSELTPQLSSFLDESHRWAQLGVLVPLTDFSDRVDSLIDSLIEDIHSRLNLFLVVGIAGTFFALFKFAFQAQSILNTAKPDVLTGQLSGALAEGLANAFPVGFIGLILMLAGHVPAHIAERRLRTSAARATQRCIRARPIGGPGESIARALQPLATLEERIAVALKPLENLQEILTSTLQPVIQSFESQLRETSQLLRQQFELVNTAVEGTKLAVTELRQPIHDMRAAVSDLPSAVAQMQQASGEARQQGLQAAAAVASLQQQASESARAVQAAAGQLGGLPAQVRDDLRQAFSEVAAQCAPAWEQVSRDLARSLGQTTTNSIGEIGAATQRACASLEQATAELNRVAVNAREALRQAVEASLTEAIRQVREPLRQVDEEFQVKYTDVVARLRDVLGESNALLSHAQQALGQFVESARCVEPAIVAWQRFETELQACTGQLQQIAIRPEDWAELRAAVAGESKASELSVQLLRQLSGEAAGMSRQFDRVRASVREIENAFNGSFLVRVPWRRGKRASGHAKGETP